MRDKCNTCGHKHTLPGTEPCKHCREQYADMYKPMTNFQACIESEHKVMAIYDMAKHGWSREQVEEWLRKEIDKTAESEEIMR